jgi:hypothetical protein
MRNPLVFRRIASTSSTRFVVCAVRRRARHVHRRNEHGAGRLAIGVAVSVAVFEAGCA